jgi:TolB-like protein
MKLSANLRASCALTFALVCINGCATNTFSFPDLFSAQSHSQADHDAGKPSKETTEMDNGIRYRPELSEQKMDMNANEVNTTALWLSQNNTYRPNFTHKSISDYAEQLAMQLMQNTSKLNTQSLVGIASFVMLDGSLQRTNVLGNQMAELFISEVQQYGMSVVDFKVMNGIQISDNGDYIFSRDTDELASKLALDYVLSGTMIQNEQGVKVSARIVSTSNKVVVSSAKVFIPHFVIEALNPRYVLVN